MFHPNIILILYNHRLVFKRVTGQVQKNEDGLEKDGPLFRMITFKYVNFADIVIVEKLDAIASLKLSPNPKEGQQPRIYRTNPTDTQGLNQT